jgi:hypothetical protein
MKSKTKHQGHLWKDGGRLLTDEREFTEISGSRYNAMAERVQKYRFCLPFSKDQFRAWLKSRFTNDGTTACVYCYQPVDLLNSEIDHMRPLSRLAIADDLAISNLTISCPSCNQIKGELTAEEFRLLRDFVLSPQNFAPEGVKSIFGRLQGYRKLVERNKSLNRANMGKRYSFKEKATGKFQ